MYDLNKINQLLATKVMGWKYNSISKTFDKDVLNYRYLRDWKPTTDIKQAKILQEKIEEKINYNLGIVKYKNRKYSYDIFVDDNYICQAKTEEMAICLCALKLWNIEEKEYKE